MRRGEVWWYEPPDAKPRPYLLLSRDSVIDNARRVLAVPATRTVRGLPTEVPVDADDGFPSPCVLSLDNVSPIERSLCTRRMTVLGPDRMASVCRALQLAVDC